MCFIYGCDFKWKMSMHQSNTDVPLYGCERPLEANAQVQNASEASTTQVESVYVENVE